MKWRVIIFLINLATPLMVFCLSFSGFTEPAKDDRGVSLYLGQSWSSYLGHLGEDFMADPGMKVFSVADGEVFRSYKWPLCDEYEVVNGVRKKTKNSHRWGGVVIVKHDLDGLSFFNTENTFLKNSSSTNPTSVVYSQYAHLTDIAVSEGEYVNKGQFLGKVGKMCAWTPHLHFEIKDEIALTNDILDGVGKGYSGTDGYAPNRYAPSKFIELNKDLIIGEEESKSEQPTVPEQQNEQSFWDKIKGWFNFGDEDGEVDSSEGEHVEPVGTGRDLSLPDVEQPESTEENEKPAEEPTYSLKFLNSNETISAQPGEELKMVVKAKNTGTAEWIRKNISANVVGGRDSNKDFYNNSWITSLRPSLLDQQNVPAGESGTFSFSINTPKDPGNYNFRIQIVRTDANFEQIEGGFWNIKIETVGTGRDLSPEEDLPPENDLQEPKKDNLVDKVVKGVKEIAKEVKEKVKKVFYGGGGGGGEEGSPSPPVDPAPDPEPEPEPELELDDPEISVLSHSTDTINQTNTATTTIFGSKNEVVSEIFLNPTSTVEYTSSTWSVDLELKEGENVFEIYGQREDGQRTPTSTVNIFLEIIEPEPELDDPVIEILSHSIDNPSYTKKSTTTISGTKNDIVTNIVFNTERTLQMTSSTWSADIELVEGENNIEIYGEREDGVKTETKTVSITLDTGAPEPPVITAIQTEFATPTIYISWSSLDGEVFDVEYNSGGEWQILFEKTTSTEYIMEAEHLRPYNFRARVYDEMENISDWNLASVIADWPKNVVINEVAWNGTGPTAAQTADEWIELYNNTDQDIDLSSWKISISSNNVNFKTLINPIIPAKGYSLLERTDDNTILDISANILYTGGLGNSGENLILSDENGNIIDQVDCSRGWYNYADSAKYRTMSRIDTNLPGSWEFNWESASGISPNSRPAGGEVIFGSPKYKNIGNLLITAPHYYYSHLLDENGKIIFGPENNPYIIANASEIPAGYTIQFEPGTILYGKDRGSYFKVKGNLILNGAVENPVIITSALDRNFIEEDLSTLNGNTAPGDWSRIEISPSGNLDVNFTKFLYGGYEAFFSLDGMFAGKKIAQVISNNNGSLNLNNVEFHHTYYNESLSPDYNAVIWTGLIQPDRTTYISNTLIDGAKNGIIMKGGILSLDNVRFNNMNTGIQVLNQEGTIQTQNMLEANFTNITDYNWYPENIFSFPTSN